MSNLTLTIITPLNWIKKGAIKMLYYIYSSIRFKLAHHGTIQQASQQDTCQSQEKITFICVLFFFYLSLSPLQDPSNSCNWKGYQLHKQLIKRKYFKIIMTKTRQSSELTIQTIKSMIETSPPMVNFLIFTLINISNQTNCEWKTNSQDIGWCQLTRWSAGFLCYILLF